MVPVKRHAGKEEEEKGEHNSRSLTISELKQAHVGRGEMRRLHVKDAVCVSALDRALATTPPFGDGFVLAFASGRQQTAAVVEFLELLK